MVQDFWHIVGISLFEGKFTVVVMRQLSNATSVMLPKVRVYTDPTDVMGFVESFDTYARCIYNVLDEHAYDTMWKKRVHILSNNQNHDRDSCALLNKRIYLEGRSDLGEMGNMRSELVYHYQHSLGEMLGVPKALQKEAIHVRFDLEDKGNLVPYWPSHLKLTPTFLAMLTCLYPFPLFKYDENDGVPAEIDYIVEEVSKVGFLERQRNWEKWHSYIAPNRLLGNKKEKT